MTAGASGPVVGFSYPVVADSERARQRRRGQRVAAETFDVHGLLEGLGSGASFVLVLPHDAAA